jgi:hypothetical protein
MASRTIIIGAAALLAFALALGCQSSDSGGGGTSAAQAQVQELRTSTPVGSLNTTKVADGRAPLRFTFIANANVRVMDATTGRPVTRATVSPNTTVRVDAESGVFADDKELARGPLPADHQYEIWMDR